ncbi:T9SS type A sorting domain-containing protein [Hymenobacter sp. BT664]|uniref:T9SS type A sorting domain-containing protein n=1 Tax=Hymenobacter montanus TaxID=2771359 RepID=A0A927BH92_9BACT|nr:PHB depolymerase family esterase [Hymenobacter montanus]MBD2770119.1 T9SS type A sorting domain-containing protein [Hymenobacter montanus]
MKLIPNLYPFFLLALIQLFPLVARAQTTVTGTIQSGGLNREYRLYVPAAYRPGTPVPLLFNLHGYGSNNLEQEAYGNFRPIADTANFLIVHPNGAVNPLGSRDWNTFLAPGSGGVDDVAFLSALLTDLQSRYSIDVNRVYSTGMSNGGFMSYELACQLSGRIAAVASVTGSITTARLAACRPQHPMPILEVHGTADTTVPYNGTSALGITFTPIPDVLSYWVQLNGCNPAPAVTMLPNSSTTDFSTVERSVWSGGRQGSEVQHLRIIGGGHTWPGASLAPGFPQQSATNPTNQDISASVEVWRFLRRFRLNRLQVLPTTPAADAGPDFTISPNPVGDDAQVLVQASRPLRPAQVGLLDALGRTLPAPAAAGPNGTVQLDLSAVPSGLYLVQVELAGRYHRYKVVR